MFQRLRPADKHLLCETRPVSQGSRVGLMVEGAGEVEPLPQWQEVPSGDAVAGYRNISG